MNNKANWKVLACTDFFQTCYKTNYINSMGHFKHTSLLFVEFQVSSILQLSTLLTGIMLSPCLKLITPFKYRSFWYQYRIFEYFSASSRCSTQINYFTATKSQLAFQNHLKNSHLTLKVACLFNDFIR